MSANEYDEAAMLIPQDGERLSLSHSEFANTLSITPFSKNENASHAELRTLISPPPTTHHDAGAAEHRISITHDNKIEYHNSASQSSVQRPIYRRILILWRNMTSLYGWRAGVMLGICTSSVVLVANICLLITGAVTRPGYIGGVASVITGDSAKISNYNMAFHILINVLSTLLLGASNYAMQVLSSPTRADADAAHLRGTWVRIGIISPINLRFMSRRRQLLWWTLTFSSLPLHLFYNSAIYPFVVNGSYEMIFVQDGSQQVKDLYSASKTTDAQYGLYGSIQNLTNWSYDHGEYSSTPGTVYLLYDQMAFPTTPGSWLPNLSSGTNSSLTGNSSSSATMNSSAPWSFLDLNTAFLNLKHVNCDWIIQDPEYSGDSRGFIPHDSPSSIHITWAFTNNTQPETSLEISAIFMLIVIVFNVLKIFAMYCTFTESQEERFITVGDAIDSYLQRPEILSGGYSTYSRDELLSQTGLGKPSGPEQKKTNKRGALLGHKGVWVLSTRRYFSALSITRKVFGMTLLLLVITAIALLVTTVSHSWYSGNADSIWGSDSQQTCPFSRSSFDTTSTLANAVLANVPQLLLSVCYLFLNSLCTAMATAREWNSLGTSRKGLRVSQPGGSQRSTYFLQLPYKYGVPLTIWSGVVHWMLSQSFFLVRTEYRRVDRTLDTSESTAACGYAPFSLAFMFGTFFLAILVIAVFACLQYQVQILFAGACSLVYSAACHPSPDEVDPHLKPVQWGVVARDENNEGPLHCTISSKPVTAPVAGTLYR